MSPAPVAIPPCSVLLLSESEALGNLDRRALRDAGAGHVEGMTSGMDAARLLAGVAAGAPGFRPDVTVCAQQLQDMSGEQFCAIVRLHPLLLDMPVLLILSDDDEMELLRTLGCGASALLARPYAVEDLKDSLASLLTLRSSLARLDGDGKPADTAAFEAALASSGMLLKSVRVPEDHFRVGMQCLEQGKWNQAIKAFERALPGAAASGKVALGMAAAWKGKGDMDRYAQSLGRAAEAFVRDGLWNRARSVYGQLLRENASARSPFLAEALKLLRQGAVEQAVAVLAQGLTVTPRQQLRDKLAQSCLAAARPAALLASLGEALERALGAEAGTALAKDIAGAMAEAARATERRRSEEAADRQRRARLAQAAKAATSAKAPDGCVPESGPAADAPQGSAAGEGAALQAGSIPPLRDAAGGRNAEVHALPLLPLEDEGEPSSRGGGDLFSVLRLTWRLARRK